MSTATRRILVTGANGHLGRLIVDGLLARLPREQVLASVRDPAAAAPLRALGVDVRLADYGRPDTLDAALAGVDTLMFVSSSTLDGRVAQHRNVVDAARRAGVGLVVYTSILRADTSPLRLADDHRATEQMLRDSGLRFALLRNGWYTENYTAAAPAAVAHGAVLGSAGDGRISSAARADYAAAAVAVLTAPDDQAGRVYELAGDDAYTRAELATELARQSGRPVAYQNLAEAEYAGALVQLGLPAPVAQVYADSETGASRGALFDGGRQLSALIGRPTTPLARTVAAALA
jgi:NAD(P)H dehydrogenase (quinone)